MVVGALVCLGAVSMGAPALAGPTRAAGAGVAGTEPLGFETGERLGTLDLGSGSSPSMLQSSVRVVFGVGFVLALLFALAFFAQKYLLKGAVIGARARFIRIVDRLILGPRKSLIVVEAYGEKFLLAAVGSGFQFLSKIEDHNTPARVAEAKPEEAAAPARPAAAAAGGGSMARWSKTLREELGRLRLQP